MNIEVVVATQSDRDVLARLLEFNAHDFSRFDGRHITTDGTFGYPYLDLYWEPSENRHPFLILVDGRIAGCVLVRAGDPHQMAEFFVLNGFRRRGVGRTAAHRVLGMFPGAWEIEQWSANVEAGAFWVATLDSLASAVDRQVDESEMSVFHRCVVRP